MYLTSIFEVDFSVLLEQNFFSVLVGNNTVILRHAPGPMFGICIQKQDGGEKKKKKIINKKFSTLFDCMEKPILLL